MTFLGHLISTICKPYTVRFPSTGPSASVVFSDSSPTSAGVDRRSMTFLSETPCAERRRRPSGLRPDSGVLGLRRGLRRHDGRFPNHSLRPPRGRVFDQSHSSLSPRHSSLRFRPRRTSLLPARPIFSPGASSVPPPSRGACSRSRRGGWTGRLRGLRRRRRRGLRRCRRGARCGG